MRAGNRSLLLIALAALVLTGCSEPRTFGSAEGERWADAWVSLITDIKNFERRIGFAPTRNFLRLAGDIESFPFCGYVSRLYLPYSYEDPAIRWFTSHDAACSELSSEVDVFVGQSEAIGERDTPVTPAMLAAPIERMLYVVIHEDCHDQFAFPYGFEEALCNVVAYEAMLAFSRERYGRQAPEYRAAERYMHEASRHARVTVAFYGKLAALYARHEQSDISTAALLEQRAIAFRNAARMLASDAGTVNNVVLANAMTYSRHHAFLDEVLEALGRDLPRAVAFFRRVDEIKPSGAEIMKAQHIVKASSVEFVRAYEAAVVETTKQALFVTRP